MSIGAAVAATLLRGLSWFLLGLATLIAALVVARLLGLQDIAPTLTDALGAVVCAALGAAARALALRFRTLT
jgi:hypothetical protein